MKVLVIEYEKLQVQKIRNLLNEIDNSITIVGVTDNMPAAGKWLQENNAPDIILARTGIMPGIDNSDVRATVTISTSNESYNFDALRQKHLEYLIDNVSEAAEKFATPHKPKNQTAAAAHRYRERFLVKHGQKLLSISVNQIAYFFSQDRFIFLKTFDNQKYLVEYRIEELEKMLSPAQFFRINRSYVVALNSVKEIHAYFGNRLKLFLHPSSEKDVIVSRKRVSLFKSWLGK
jgi:DNA-binding LytR/AlgR family response regulator